MDVAILKKTFIEKVYASSSSSLLWDSLGVQRPLEGRQKSTATTAHASSCDVKPPTGTISHRFPRAAHNVRRHTVSKGKTEDSALVVQVWDYLVAR